MSKPVTLSGQPGDDAKQYQERAVRLAIEESLFYGGCHGPDPRAVFSELCDLVESSIQVYEREGRPLPEPLSGRDFVNALQRIA